MQIARPSILKIEAPRDAVNINGMPTLPPGVQITETAANTDGSFTYAYLALSGFGLGPGDPDNPGTNDPGGRSVLFVYD